MAVKIRLARKGRKKMAFYHIVVADSRSPRDGRFIERLGLYDPNTNPATIEIDFDRSLEWLQKGAQPTDTCRAILSYRGILIKKHLLEGVKKGAFDEAEADRRFNEWLAEKDKSIDLKRSSLEKDGEEKKRKRIEEERLINETRAAEIVKKAAALAASEAAGAEPSEEVAEVSEPSEEEVSAGADTVAESVQEEAVVETEPSAEAEEVTEAAPPEVSEEATEEEVVTEEATETEVSEEPAEETKEEEETPEKE
ncbi:MAG: 30S ribosomal protein S16 [Bacteroidales bacterium]